MSFSDTIFAVASGTGRTALTVLRVSGPRCAAILSGLCTSPPAPRQAALRRLRRADGVLLDQAIVLWFPGPASYTGEDCLELHLHGGAAVLEGVVAALLAHGSRPAQPGEFTRRAVGHGRIDLLEAEGIADLIDAQTDAQRDQALRQMGGGLSSVHADWAARLLRLLAQQEALIDFPDEELPPEVEAAMLADIRSLQAEFTAHLAEASRGERLRTGLVFAIAGAPNAGKSTLINALCQRDVAIVSPHAGTTRDVLEARVEIAGVPVTMLDTAGLRVTGDDVEAEGVRRARLRVADADLVLALKAPDAGTGDGAGQPGAHDDAWNRDRVVHVATKFDLGCATGFHDIAVSAKTGDGMDRLLALLEHHTRLLAGISGSPVFTRARHRTALAQAADHLAAGLDARWPELRGEELRLAVQALGRITGTVGVEDVLDSVFGQFCIGK